ncbi:MAG: cytochrome c family protein [Pseudomonadota bacterium]
MNYIHLFSARSGYLRLSLSVGFIIAAALFVSWTAAADDGAITAGMPAHLGTADVGNGEKLFKRRCRACHTNTKDGPNKTGPNLWNIVGREQGAKEGVRYSEGMKAKGGHWGFAELDAFLTRPADYVPDTRMAFPGLRKASDRADLIAYLRSLSDDPLPFSMN